VKRSPDDDILEELEESHRQRLEDQLDSVKGVLQKRKAVNKELVKELDEEIRRQKKRLDNATREDEPEIREGLRELYRERRREKRSYWQDREDWLERKIELKEELAKIDESEKFL